MTFQATRNFVRELHSQIMSKRYNTREERDNEYVIFFQEYKEKYFPILRPIFEKFVERINLFLKSKGQTHINIELNAIEMDYASVSILAISRTDYVNIFEIEDINEIGICRFEHEFIKHLIDLDVNELIKSVNDELEFAFQSSNINFKCKQSENEIDLVEVAYTTKKMLLITLDIHINNEIILFFLNFPTEISKILK